MRTVSILLGNTEGLLNNFLEVLLRDACGDHSQVRCTRTGTREEFAVSAVSGRFDLGIMIPNNLPNASMGLNRFAEACQAIRHIKRKCPVPLLVVAAFDERPQQEAALIGAGADAVLELPFQPAELQSLACRLLGLALASAEISAWSLADTLTHGLRPGAGTGAFRDVA